MATKKAKPKLKAKAKVKDLGASKKSSSKVKGGGLSNANTYAGTTTIVSHK